MSKPRKDEPLKMPYYRGGEEGLRQFVMQKLQYPEEALKNKIEGDVEASYDVDGLGRTRNIRILSSLGYGCDEEVIRLVKLIKYEKAYNKGRNVTLHRKLKVNFKLSKDRKISYQLVKSTSKEKEQNKQSTSKTVTYTIKMKE